jgi:hypothetical protein
LHRSGRRGPDCEKGHEKSFDARFGDGIFDFGDDGGDGDELIGFGDEGRDRRFVFDVFVLQFSGSGLFCSKSAPRYWKFCLKFNIS